MSPVGYVPGVGVGAGTTELQGADAVIEEALTRVRRYHSRTSLTFGSRVAWVKPPTSGFILSHAKYGVERAALPLDSNVLYLMLLSLCSDNPVALLL